MITMYFLKIYFWLRKSHPNLLENRIAFLFIRKLVCLSFYAYRRTTTIYLIEDITKCLSDMTGFFFHSF